MEIRRVPRILVIDDDASFGRLMVQVAKRLRVPLSFGRSMRELDDLLDADGSFDVVVIDYFLDEFEGSPLTNLKGTQMARLFKEVPVVIVSGLHEGPAAEECPACVKKFVSKREGGQQIIEAAFAVFEGMQSVARPVQTASL